MATKVDRPSSVEPHRTQLTVSTTTLSTSSSPKVSMFGAKSGFVIPKNKRSGSMVPIFRGSGKVESDKTVKEETQVQRKTKWGVDLAQDSAVRKGRALAYQTRLEQITQQLKFVNLETGDDQGSQTPRKALDQEPAGDMNTEHAPQYQQSQKIKALELERQEIIGELLCLIPNFKAPPDYKPLLKESKVPVPHKAYPGYNFIGLLLGPESNSLKGVEEETGASIHVYGMKMDTEVKYEITRSTITGAESTYEELYVNVSADTYEKVDAAVELIERLVTPVSGGSAVVTTGSSSVASDGVNVHDPNRDSAFTFVTVPIKDANQGMPNPTFFPSQSGPPQYQPYPTPWFPIMPSNAQSNPPSGFMPAHMPSNPIRFPSSPAGPLNIPPYFSQPPFGSVIRNTYPIISRPQLPMQVMPQPPNHTMPPQNRTMPGQQPHLTYTSMRPQPSYSGPSPFTSFQPLPTIPVSASQQHIPVNPQSASTASMGLLPNRSPTVVASTGNSPRWANVPPTIPSPNNTAHMAPRSIHPTLRPPQPVTLTANVSPRPHAANFAPPVAFPSRPTGPPAFSSVPPAFPVSVPSVVSSSPLGVPMSGPATMTQTMPSSAPGTFTLPPAAPAQASHRTIVPQIPATMTQTMLSSAPGTLILPPAAPAQASHRPIVPQIPASMPQPVAPMMSQSPSTPSHNMSQGMGQPSPLPLAPPLTRPALRPTQLPVQSLQPLPAGPASVPGNFHSFTPVKPAADAPVTPLSAPVAAPKLLRPNFGDFTFQPLRAKFPTSPTTPPPSSPSVVPNASQIPISAPQAPSYWPALQIPSQRPQVGAHSFPRLVAINQTISNQAPLPPAPTVTPFPVNPIGPQPRLSFQNMSSIQPMAQSTNMAPPSFSPAPQPPDLVRSSNFLQAHQNQLPPTSMPSSIAAPTRQLGNNPFSFVPASRPSSITTPNQQLGNNPLNFVAGRPPSSPGGNQIYDPFSPTSVSSQQAGEPMKARKPDANAEYEDLMASVGVK